MAHISEKHKDVFSDVSHSFSNYFTTDEVEEVNQMADRLRAILDATIERQEESLKRNH